MSVHQTKILKLVGLVETLPPSYYAKFRRIFTKDFSAMINGEIENAIAICERTHAKNLSKEQT